MSAIPVEVAALSAKALKTALSVRVCHTWNELEQFRGDWNSLLRANPLSSIFQTPEWLASWRQA
jgi:CelD/BcsL family acetyltransferase involved in cellulose biosynthesis